MHVWPHRRHVLFALLFLSAHPAFPFAYNNVRTDRFEWMHVQTEHFDVYYDSATGPMVHRMAHYLEKAWKDVGERLDYKVEERTPFFFYSNHNQFEQTNVVSIGEGTGGVTEAFKNRFLIFNDGSETWQEHVIAHEFAHVVQFNVLYGGWWKSVRLLKSPFYPLWVMEGMAEFASGDVDAPTGDMVVRDAVANDQLPSLAELQGFAHLKPNQITLGYKTGEAAMTFLEDEYGKGRVHDLLVKIKDHFDVSQALEELLGIDLTRFDFRFREWLKDYYADFLARAKPPTAFGHRISAPDGIPQSNQSPAISPDGKKMYYFSDRGGPTQVYEHDLASGESRPLIGLKYTRYENIHSDGRALSVSRDGRWLAFAGEKTQRDYLYLFDLKRRKLRRVKLPFVEVRSPSFSPTTDNLVCVGMTNGYNDLYLIDRKGHVVKRLTDSAQDERHPVFSPDGRSVVFSGETLQADQQAANGRDLFEIRLADGEMKSLGHLKGAETEPWVLPDNSVLFVRDMDEQGIGFNLYRRRTDGAIERLTDLIGGAFTPSFDASSGSLYFVAFHAGERHIYKFTAPLSVTPPVVAESEAAPVEESDPFSVGEGEARLPRPWPRDGESPLIVAAPKPYRFKASTDLFLPFFFYSTVEGLVVADVWQFSELMGNHQFQQQMQYASGNDFLDLAMFYTYARFRPQFTLGFRTLRYYEDIDEEDQRREVNGVALVSYPLDRVRSISLGAGTVDQKETFPDEEDEEPASRDRFLFANFSHDTVTGRYLIPTKGRRLSLYFQQGIDSFNGDQRYKSGGFSAAQYVSLPRESTLATRLFYGRSIGPEAQEFRLGGVDRVRGVSNSRANRKANVALSSAEIRMRIKYLNARTKFLFPDFFFKAAYLIAFDDIGYAWDTREEREAFSLEDAENSAGLGISWPTFVLQSFRLDFTVLWAKRTTDGSDIWYVTLGPTF